MRRLDEIRKRELKNDQVIWICNVGRVIFGYGVMGFIMVVFHLHIWDWQLIVLVVLIAGLITCSDEVARAKEKKRFGEILWKAVRIVKSDGREMVEMAEMAEMEESESDKI